MSLKHVSNSAFILVVQQYLDLEIPDFVGQLIHHPDFTGVFFRNNNRRMSRDREILDTKCMMIGERSHCGIES